MTSSSGNQLQVEQFAFAASFAPQVLDCAKSPAFAPPMAIPLIQKSDRPHSQAK